MPSDLLTNSQFNANLGSVESYNAALSARSFPEIIKATINGTSPPLWNIFERLVFDYIGSSEVHIRGLSFLFFLLTVIFTYKIGKELFSKKTGLLAAALTALNPYFFIYAFEGSLYSVLALGVTSSMYFFLKLTRPIEERRFAMVGYVITTTCALYSHHFAIFSIIVQGFWFLFELVRGKRNSAKRLFKAFFVVGLLYLPWLWPLYNQMANIEGIFLLPTPTTNDLKVLVYDFIAQGIKVDSLKIPILNNPLYEASLYLVFTLLVLRRWHKGIKNTFFLLLWFLGPILITWFVSQYFSSIFKSAYLLYTIPAAMLVVSSKGRKYSGLITGILAIFFLIIDIHYFLNPSKLPVREIVEHVNYTKNNGDYLINWGLGSHFWESKYYGLDAPIYLSSENSPRFTGTSLMTPEDIIRKLPDDVTRIGVITSGQTSDVSLENFSREELKDINGLKFMWYRKIDNK